MKLDTRVSNLNRVGKAAEKRLKQLGIETVQDLLFYFPFRYEDFSHSKAIADLKDGEQVTVKGKIELIANKRSPRKRMVITEAVVADESGQLKVVWFGQAYIAKNLKAGDTVHLSGKVKEDMFGVQMTGPSYEKVPDSKSTAHTARIVPMYPLTFGLTQKQVRFLIKQVIDLSSNIEEWLPDDLQEKADLMPFAEAIRAIHFPDSSEELTYAERRLKFDELFVLQLRAEMIRQSLKRFKAPEIRFNEEKIKEFVTALPFELTKDQKVAAWEIFQDIEKAEPMNRLLEGDVGSGKTVVAAMSLHSCLLNNFQGVMVAPTEILAKQHFESITKLIPKSRTVLFTRSQIAENKKQITDNLKKSKKAKREAIYGHIKDGSIDIVIGTHAVLQDKVEFKNLALVVVDEQHRFGVGQRKKLKEKSGDSNTTPHFLSMTATPIPRSFALTLYGDLDISMIKEKPAGRKEIKTRLVEPKNRSTAYSFIRGQIDRGRQVFVICPLISVDESVDSETGRLANDEKKTVMDEYEKLSKKVFPDLKIGFLHGRLKAIEKDETMQQFTKGELDILVSTSVVEVGVDIPNASVMMIEGAENFGLAQLHQFRGRVGRSSHQSYCFLFTDSDSQKVGERLGFFEKNTDGFKLAEYDLEMRGPGEVYGTSQSGMMNLKLATMKDIELIKLARELARGIDFEKYYTLRNKVKEWENAVHLE